MLSVDEQMRIITSGAAKIVPEADLRKKLEKGEPLNIKLGVDPTSPDLHLGHAVPCARCASSRTWATTSPSSSATVPR